MKKEDYLRASEISQSIECIENLKRKMHFSYPSFIKSIIYGLTYNNNMFLKLDEKTNKLLKDEMEEVLNKRQKELRKELDIL